MHGDSDNTVPVAWTRSLIDELRAADVDVSDCILSGRGHGLEDLVDRG